ncbi:tetratricopeptide repeat protein [Neptuniibacter sp.]|uniref:tetratricopeptide repeat protein n=1 Tax=Neptuniibacter sp. TaxID=1962643 RepID=UPI00260E3361|nr:tetratricopeptide repeat protein [Neptuniibacter sp.]MCP4596721.1 sel1 repeat family protein [Neptuniibacter sp.]
MKKQILLAASLMLSISATNVMAADLGKGTLAFEKQDYATAMKELKSLAREGNPDAMNMVGQMYENGWGVDKDVKKARRMYNRGASLGHMGSVNSLRAMKDKDYKVELETVVPAAESGDPSAQNRLGEMAEFGYGMERNPDLAIQWYLKAADQGYVAAQHNIGRCYNFGTGVEQDFVEAERWYRQAAERGHTDAMFFLGTLYSNEHGSQADQNTNILAYAWMHNAAQLGNRTAIEIEKRLIMKLDASQLATAKELAEEYRVKYVGQ